MRIRAYTLSHYPKSDLLFEVLEFTKLRTRIKVDKLHHVDKPEDKWFEFCVENDIVFVDNGCPAILFQNKDGDKWQLLGTSLSGMDKLYELGSEFVKK